MPSNALKTLRETLKRGSQGGAYYICGEDDFQKEDATKALINSAVDPSVRDFNLDVLRGSDVDSRAFESIVSSIPMMADKRVVVIRDTGALRKDARKAVERYLANPSADVVLLLVESSGGKTAATLSEPGSAARKSSRSSSRLSTAASTTRRSERSRMPACSRSTRFESTLTTTRS